MKEGEACIEIQNPMRRQPVGEFSGVDINQSRRSSMLAGPRAEMKRHSFVVDMPGVQSELPFVTSSWMKLSNSVGYLQGVQCELLFVSEPVFECCHAHTEARSSGMKRLKSVVG